MFGGIIHEQSSQPRDIKMPRNVLDTLISWVLAYFLVERPGIGRFGSLNVTY
jgi:hypothetical protein